MKREDLAAFIQGKARVIREEIIKMLARAGSGHPGGSLSSVEIVASLYFGVMKHRPHEPGWPDRDRFVLSKGHAAPLLYAVLAECGYFPKVWLESLRKLGSPLQGHPDRRKVPGVEASTGSLGQGFGWAVGMALANKLDERESRVFVLLGDGELQEGMVWEGAMAAAHYKLDNLVAVVDYNGLQIDGPVSEIMSPLPIAEKFSAFGWHAVEVDGHDVAGLLATFEDLDKVKGLPKVVVARTVKGRGVSFMENEVGWHGTAPSLKEAERALRELRGEG